jgi:hypothetical protein
VTSDELVVVVLASVVPLVVPILTMFIGLFTGGIQALFFCKINGIYSSVGL